MCNYNKISKLRQKERDLYTSIQAAQILTYKSIKLVNSKHQNDRWRIKTKTSSILEYVSHLSVTWSEKNKQKTTKPQG